MEVTQRLDRLRIKEDARPYYHYKNLYHDPRGATLGKSVIPSPLVESTGDVLIKAHFQIDAKGAVNIPPVNEELSQFSKQQSLAQNAAILKTLRESKSSLRIAPALLAMHSPKGEEPIQSQQMQAPIQQQQFQAETFIQNMAPNEAFNEIVQQSQKKGGGREDVGDENNTQVVDVSVHGFLWKSVELAGQPALVALRQIETPTGNLDQGVWIDVEKMQEWLNREGGAGIAFTQGDALTTKESLPLPSLPGWHLEADIRANQDSANRRAAGVQSSFLWRFIPTSLLSFALFFVLVAAVSRSEKLAMERSQFAAAAAHELRTPLAGLQLYGDMLAEGLGNPAAKEKYARHIADEAQRLGRVVSNVLGFTQLERGGISVNAKRGDLSASVEKIVLQMRPSLEKLGMKVHLQAGSAVQAVFDEDALCRVVQNLLDNAEKYTRNHKRDVYVDVQDKGWVIVRDLGPGISLRMQKKVFQPFERNEQQDGPSGLGLGLALAHALAKQQGGDLRLTPSAEGAQFVLELRQAPPQHATDATK